MAYDRAGGSQFGMYCVKTSRERVVAGEVSHARVASV